MMRALELAVTALVAVGLTLAITDYRTAQTNLPNGVVTIDASKAILAFIDHGGRDLEEADYQTELLAFHRKLEQAVAELAADQNVMVVNGSAVLAGARDITNFVVQSALESR